MTGSILRFAILCKEKELIQPAPCYQPVPTPVIPVRPVAQSDSCEERVRFVGQASHESVEIPKCTNQGFTVYRPLFDYRTGRVHDLRYGFSIRARDDLSIPPTFGRIRSSLPCLRRSFLPSRPNLSLRYALAPIPSRVSKLSGHKQTNPASADAATHQRALVVQDWRIVAAASKKRFHETLEVNPYRITQQTVQVSSAGAQTDKAMGGRAGSGLSIHHPPSTIDSRGVRGVVDRRVTFPHSTVHTVQ